MGEFPVPLEKTVMFLTAPTDHSSAALSGLSDELQPAEGRCSEEFSRAGRRMACRDC